jgi:hypothetical protein
LGLLEVIGDDCAMIEFRPSTGDRCLTGRTPHPRMMPKAQRRIRPHKHRKFRVLARETANQSSHSAAKPEYEWQLVTRKLAKNSPSG